MQLVSSRIWTLVAVSISYDDNHYTTDSYRFWDLFTTGQLVDDVQQKKKTGFH